MPKHRDEDIPIAKLILDANNPRHPFQNSQREILRWMTHGTGRIGQKVITLAKDIVDYGLNPAERVMVIMDENNPAEYLVIEGNRRVAAIKLLNKPSMAPTEDSKRRFQKLRGTHFPPIKKVPCTVFSSLEDAYHFIELKHYGEFGGAGVVPWDAEQKARNSLRLQKQSRHHKAIAVLDFVKSRSKDHEARTFASGGFPITTLDRLLSDRDFREFLGLTLGESGEIIFRVAPEEALKPINRVIKDFGSGKKNVRDVINKEKRSEYLNGISPSERADLAKILQDQVSVNDATTESGQQSGGKHLQATYQDPRSRKTVVIPGTAVSINAAKYNRARRVFDELRRIQLKDRDGKPAFPNAAILLERLFIEMSVDLYINAKTLTHPKPTGWNEVSLAERTRVVLEDLEKVNGIERHDAKVMRKCLGNANKLAHPNSLNDYAHNPSQVVNPSDIIDIWDTYTRFLTALWGALQ